MEAKDRLIVALDFPTYKEAYKVAEKLGEHVWGFKVGLELIHSKEGGPKVVSGLQTWASANIFYDCKLKDTPNTIARTVRNIVSLQVRMFNVHCLGGVEMMKAARQAAEEEAGKAGIQRPLVLGVTILTSLGVVELDQLALINQGWGLTDRVYHLATLAKFAGLDGVIASPQEIAAIRNLCGPDFLIVTPGIRSSDAPPDDQKRTATPAEAIDAGADWIVVGRIVTQNPNPSAMIDQIIAEIEPYCVKNLDPCTDMTWVLKKH